MVVKLSSHRRWSLVLGRIGQYRQRQTNPCPCVFLLSGNDEVVGYRFQQMVFQAYAGDKTLIDRPAAGHNDAIDPETAARINAAVLQIASAK